MSPLRDRRLRSRLCHGTAVAAVLALLPQAATAGQALPTGGTIAAGTVVATGTGATVTGTGTALLPFLVAPTANNGALNLAIGTGAGIVGQSAIVNWTSFDIGSTAAVNNSVNFTGAGGLAYSVLNRVTGGAITTIAGSITGGGNGTVFLLNEAGISFKGLANVANLTGFVASSLDITNADFNALITASTPIRFAPSLALGTGTGTGGFGIVIDPGAVIAPNSVLLLVTPQLTSSGTLSATGGTAAVIVANDATVTLSPNSLISVAIAKGTTLLGSIIGATVNGQRVLLAAAGNATVLTSLLGVAADLSATTATATDKGIVIAVGRDTLIDATNSVTVTVPFVANASVTGALTSTGRIDAAVSGTLTVGDVLAKGDGAALTAVGGLTGTAGHSIAAVADVALRSDGAVLVDAVRAGGTIVVGGVTGANALSVTGDSVRAGGGVTVNSAGVITLTGLNPPSVAATGFRLDPTLATFTGAPVAPADVTLTAGGAVTLNDATSTRDIVASGTNFVLGTAGATHALTSGATATIKLAVTDTSATAIVTHGDFKITGGAVVLQDGSSLGANLTQDDTLTVTGTRVLTGNVASTGAGAFGSGDVKLTATGGTASSSVSAGTVAARRAILVKSSNGDVTLGGATSGDVNRAVTVTAARVATVAGAVTSTGSYTVSGGDVSLGGSPVTQRAVGDVLIQATTGDITGAGTLIADSAGVGAGHLLVLDSVVGAIKGTLNLAAGTARQSDILIRVHDNFKLGSIDARSLAAATAGAVPLAATDYSAVTPDMLSTGNAISLGAVTTAHAVTIGSTGTVAGHQDVATGVVTSGGAVAVSSATGNVTLGGASSGAGLNDVIVTAAQVATISGAVTSSRDYTVGGGSVVLGQTGSGRTVQSAERAVSITATTGAITSGATAAIDPVALISNFSGTAIGGAAPLTLKAATNIGDAANPSLISVYGGATSAGIAERQRIFLDVLSSGAGGSITLGSVRGASVTTPGAAAATLQATGAITLGGVDVDFGLTAIDTNIVSAAAVTLTSLKALEAGNIAISGTTISLGSAGVARLLSTGNAATNSVTLTASGGGAAAVSTHGDFTITAPGAVVLQQSAGVAANVTQDDSLAITGQNIFLGNVTSAATGSFGAGAVTLAATGGALGDGVTAGALAARTGVLATSLSGDVTLGGAAAGGTANDVRVSAAGAATVGGNVTSTGSYSVKGTTVAIGGAGTTQTAVGDVLIQATSGNLFASGTIVADSGATPTGTRTLVLDSSNAILGAGGGPVSLRAGSASLIGNRSNVLLRFANGTNLTLGDIDAKVFAQATAAGIPATAAGYSSTGILTTSAAITLGTVRTVASNVIQSTGALAGARDIVVAGDTSSTGSVLLASSNGDVTANGPVAAKGFAQLSAFNGTTLAASVRSSTNLVGIIGGVGVGASTAALTIAAGTDVSVRSDGTIALGDIRAGGGITVGGLINPAALSLTGGSLQANGSILVSATGPIDLSAGVSVATERGLLNAALTAFDGPPSASDAAVIFNSGGAIKLNALASTGNIILSGAGAIGTLAALGAGAITVSGSVTAGDALSAPGTGNYTLIGSSIGLGGIGVVQSAIGDVLIRSTVSDITAAGELVAASAGVSGKRLVLDAAASVAAAGLDLRAGSTATATAANRSDILLRVGSGQAIIVGAVDAASIGSATAGAAPTTVAAYTPVVDGGLRPLLTTGGAITTGAVAAIQSIQIETSGTLPGARDISLGGVVSASGRIQVIAADGNVTVGGAVKATDVLLSAGNGVLSIDDVSAFTGGAALTGGSGITIGIPGSTVAALTNVTLKSDRAITVGTIRAGGALSIGGNLLPGAASLAATSLQAAGDIGITTVHDIGSLAAPVSFPGQREAINADLSGFHAAVVPDASLTLTSTGGAVFAGGLVATGSIALTAATTASVIGNVTAGDGLTTPGSGNYTVIGGNVVLGAAGVDQKAIGDVLIRSTVSSLAAAGTLTAGRRLVLDSATSIDGIVSILPPVLTFVKLVAATDVLVRTGPGGALTVGAVDADRLATAVPLVAHPATASDYAAAGVGGTPTLTTDGAISLGAVTTVQSNAIGSTGTLVSQRDVTVVSDTSLLGSIDLGSTSGAVTVSGVVTAATSIGLHADFTLPNGGGQGLLTTGGDLTASGGGLTLIGGTGIAKLAGPPQIIAASGNILLGSTGAIAVDTVLAGGAISTEGLLIGASPTLSTTFTATTLQANGAISVVTSGDITLSGTGATRTATERAGFDPVLRSFTIAGAPAADAGLSLTSTSGAVTVVDLATTGSIALAAANAVTVSGNGHAGDVSTLGGHGNYQVTGGAIALGGGTLGQAALGDVVLTSPGAITLTAIRAGGAIVAVGPLGGNAASLTGDSLGANGLINVATSGAIKLAGVDAPSVRTYRAGIDADLGGFHGATLVPDADITLRTTLGTIMVNNGAATGNLTLTAGTAGVVGTGDLAGDIVATGVFTAGDIGTAATASNLVFTARGDVTLPDGAATRDIVVTSTAGDATIVTAIAADRSDALVNAAVTGLLQAQSFATGGHATITSGTTTRGDVNALATQSGGIATITSGTAHIGNVLADGDLGATITTGQTFDAASGDVAAHSAFGAATVATGNAVGNVTAIGATAHINFGHAGGSVRALADSGAATVDSGLADTGNVDALGAADATLTLATATLGNVRATSTGGGTATITTGTARQSVIANGGSVVAGSATAGDDIILAASNGAVTATTLTITGAAASEVAATDASGAALSFGAVPLDGLGGSNAVIRATGLATISGVVSVAQADAAKSANFDVTAGAITLGNGAALDQRAAGRIDLQTTSGDVTLAGGMLQSNFSGARTANALANAATAGGGLTISAAGNVTGAVTALVAGTKTLAVAPGFDTQARQPGVSVSAETGAITLASITGGAITVTAPLTIAVPLVTATGDVALRGTAAVGNDVATIAPTTITIDGLNAGYGRADVTVAGGAGAEVTALKVLNGGRAGTLGVLSDTGAATLRATPNDPAVIAAIVVESQTGVAGILNSVGGAATTANPNTVAAGTITLRGRQAGSGVAATGPLLATGSILATGPTVTLGTVAVAGTAADGPGDILIAATGAASLAAGSTETATARRSITVTGGSVSLGSGTATGGTLALRGGIVTIARDATAGDDILLSSSGVLAAANATLTTTGAADLQGGNDAATVDLVAVGTAAGTGYGVRYTTMLTDALTPATDAVTGGALTRLAGSNLIASAGGDLQLGVAVLTANNDLRLESGGSIVLAGATAGRALVAAAAGSITPSGTLSAGDDIVLVTGGTLDLHAAQLVTTGLSADLSDARRGDGTLLASPAAGGALTDLAGSTIALAATGPITLGSVATNGLTPSSLRVFSGAEVTTTQAIATSGSIVIAGATVASPFALTAGDDIVAVARSGTATLDGVLTTTGAAASDTPLRDLAGDGIALPGEAALGRVDGASILVAATGVANVTNDVISAGRYSVYGRSGINLGTAVALPGAPTLQSSARDVLLEASVGASPLAASITLADDMTLVSNSDGVGTGAAFSADSLVIRIGNGALLAGGATLRADRSTGPAAAATLAFQPTVQVQAVVADGIKSIAIASLDSASADLRALGDVVVGTGTIDAGLTLSSKAGLASLTSLTVGAGVPLMTAAEAAAIDLKIVGATGAALGSVAAPGANLLRDVTVATIGGNAAIIGAASARDDIVVTSASGTASAHDLTFAGAASDSEGGVATLAATNANGIALVDPYLLSGATITGLAGRNIVVAGATGATLDTVTTLAGDGLGDVRVTTAAGPATLTTIATGGVGLPTRVIVATRNGDAVGTTLNASSDIIVDATLGTATLTTGNAGRDGIVIGPSVSIGSLTAGDDVVALASGGTLVAGTLISTGANSGDGVAAIARADGAAIADPVAGASVGGLLGGNVVALASGDVTVINAAATAAAGATSPGLVRIASFGGMTTVTSATASAGDVIIGGAVVDVGLINAGRDGSVIANNGTMTLASAEAGRDLALTAATDIIVSGSATAGGAASLTAGRDIDLGSSATSDALVITAAATLIAGRDIVVAQRLASGSLTATAGGAAALTGTTTAAVTTITTQGSLTSTADLTAGDALTLTSASGAIAAPTLTGNGIALSAAGNIAVAGAVTSSGDLTVTGGSIAFGSFDTGGDATLRGSGGTGVGGLGKAGSALDALSSGGALSFGSTRAGTALTLRGAQGIIVTGTTDAGTTATLTADAGSVVTGDIAATGDVLVTATGGSATLGSISKSARLTVATAGDATITGAVTTSGDTAITSANGGATIGGAVRTANYTVKAANGTIALGAGVIQSSSGTTTLDSQRLTIGAGTSVVATTAVQLNVTGNAAGVSLGDGAGAAGGTTRYTLTKADLRKFQTPKFEIAAAALPVDIGEVDLDAVVPVAGGFAGVAGAFGIRTTGDIRVADRLTFTSLAGTPVRVLTLGGAAGGTDLDKTTPTANAIKVTATSALDNGAPGTGGQIDAAGSTVQLRAAYIALGETPSPAAGRPFIDALLPVGGTPLTTAVTRTQYVDNASSTLYVAIAPYARQAPVPLAIVKAGTLVLAAGQWALIQNTGLTTTPGGGIEIGALKLNKVAGAAAADPVIAVFGSLAGKTGVASAISVNAANLDGISPNNIRVNGCVALSTAGCIQSAVAIPLINLSDPGRTLLISSAPDLALSVELITGSTNEALWREDDDEPGQNRPQRESRP